MPTEYTDGPELPDASSGTPAPYIPNPVSAPVTQDSSPTGQTNRTEYTDGPEPTQAET